MTNYISLRAQSIKPSPTLALAAKAKELQAQGKAIIDLTVGEPDFPTPEFIKQAAVKALHDDFTKYTAVDGIPALKQAIITKFATENNLRYEAKNILVSCGAKHSIYNFLQAVLNPGDEVIIPAPYWVSYPDMALLASGKPVFIHTTAQQNFKINKAQLEKIITSRSKVIIINSPSNPTGVAYTKAELQSLGEVLVKYPNLLVLSDDIYEHILWGQNSFTNILNAYPDLFEQTIVINGVSKAYAMTGWRIGYAAGPENIIAAMKNIQSQSTSNPCSIAQVAAQTGLQGDQSFIPAMMKIFKERHDYLVAALNKLPGFKVAPVDGAFYLFPDVTGAMQKTNCQTDVEFAALLLDKAEIAVVPGSAFGAPGHVRISYATSLALLKTAIARIQSLF